MGAPQGKRYLNPLLGRWVSPDPLGVHVPGEADWNLYAYVKGQALRAVDRTGLDIDDVLTRNAAKQAVRDLARRGLSLKFAEQEVRGAESGGSYIVEGRKNQYWQLMNEVSLTRSTREQLQGRSQAVGIGDLYEELAHARLYKLEESNVQFRALVGRAENYYRSSPLKSGGTTSNPNRLVHEAAAGYVSSVVAGWQLTYEGLTGLRTLVGQLDPNKVSGEQLAKLRATRDYMLESYRQMRANAVHGYSKEGGFLGIGSEQDPTTAPLPQELKSWLDANMLEGKVSAEVQDDATLGGILDDINRAFSAIESARQSAK